MLRALTDQLQDLLHFQITHHTVPNTDAAAAQLQRSPVFTRALQQLVSSDVEVGGGDTAASTIPWLLSTDTPT